MQVDPVEYGEAEAEQGDLGVPGHGPLSTKKDFKKMKEYLLLLDAKARELAVGSQDADAIAAELKKVLPKRSLAEWMIGFNLKSRYLTK